MKVIYKIIDKLKRKILSSIASFLLKEKVNVFGIFSMGDYRNITIGKDCRINKGVYLLGRNRINIGNNVVLSAEVMILDSGLDIEKLQENNSTVHTDSFVVLQDNVWVGARATILPGVTVHRNSIIAAASVVTKDVEAYTIVAGNPARVIKKLTKKLGE